MEREFTSLKLAVNAWLVLLGFLLMSCKQAGENAKAKGLKREIEELEKEKGEVDHGVGLSHGAISVGAWIIGLDPENRLGFGEHARPGRAWQLPRLARDSCDSVE